jgi:hypothetical protein
MKVSPRMVRALSMGAMASSTQYELRSWVRKYWCGIKSTWW